MNRAVRRLQPGDELLALQVVRTLIPNDERDGLEPSIDHLRRMLRQDTNYVIAATVDEQPVGFLTAYRVPSLNCDSAMVYLFEIEVAASHRRQGLATQMINLLKTLCRADAADEIWVGTDNPNIAAKQLYTSTGGICEYPDNCEFKYYLQAESLATA